MLRSTSVPSSSRRLELHAVDDSAVGALLRRFRITTPTLESTLRRPAESTIPPVLTAGSTVANIWVRKFPIGGGPATNALVPMTFETQSAHGNIWIDNSLLAGPNASQSFGSGTVAQSTATIGQDFEIGYASDTAHFASPDYAPNAPGVGVQSQTCDESGRPVGQSTTYIAEPADHRINVAVLSSVSDALGDGVGGYFTDVNYGPQAVLNCLIPMGMNFKSNEAPMIYVVWTDSVGAVTELTDDQITATAHELQHLINFVNHTLLPPGAGNPGFVSNETSTNNEGLAVLAQDLAIHAKYPSVAFDTFDGLSLAANYLASPQNFSITGFIGIDPGASGPMPSCRGCYGGAYLFARYLYDRFGGDAYAHAMETSGLTGFANLAASCACHETAQQLLQDFLVAMAANSIGLTPPDAAYQLGTLNVHGKYPSPIAEQPGRQLLGLNAIVVPDGGVATANAPLGGAAFFSVHASGGVRVPIKIKDENPGAGFGLTGALVQR